MGSLRYFSCPNPYYNLENDEYLNNKDKDVNINDESVFAKNNGKYNDINRTSEMVLTAEMSLLQFNDAFYDASEAMDDVLIANSANIIDNKKDISASNNMPEALTKSVDRLIRTIDYKNNSKRNGINIIKSNKNIGNKKNCTNNTNSSSPLPLSFSNSIVNSSNNNISGNNRNNNKFINNNNSRLRFPFAYDFHQELTEDEVLSAADFEENGDCDNSIESGNNIINIKNDEKKIIYNKGKPRAIRQRKTVIFAVVTLDSPVVLVSAIDNEILAKVTAMATVADSNNSGNNNNREETKDDFDNVNNRINDKCDDIGRAERGNGKKAVESDFEANFVKILSNIDNNNDNDGNIGDDSPFSSPLNGLSLGYSPVFIASKLDNNDSDNNKDNSKNSSCRIAIEGVVISVLANHNNNYNTSNNNNNKSNSIPILPPLISSPFVGNGNINYYVNNNTNRDGNINKIASSIQGLFNINNYNNDSKLLPTPLPVNYMLLINTLYREISRLRLIINNIKQLLMLNDDNTIEKNIGKDDNVKYVDPIEFAHSSTGVSTNNFISTSSYKHYHHYCLYNFIFLSVFLSHLYTLTIMIPELYRHYLFFAFRPLNYTQLPIIRYKNKELVIDKITDDFQCIVHIKQHQQEDQTRQKVQKQSQNRKNEDRENQLNLRINKGKNKANDYNINQYKTDLARFIGMKVYIEMTMVKNSASIIINNNNNINTKDDNDNNNDKGSQNNENTIKKKTEIKNEEKKNFVKSLVTDNVFDNFNNDNNNIPTFVNGNNNNKSKINGDNGNNKKANDEKVIAVKSIKNDSKKCKTYNKIEDCRTNNSRDFDIANRDRNEFENKNSINEIADIKTEKNGDNYDSKMDIYTGIRNLDGNRDNTEKNTKGIGEDLNAMKKCKKEKKGNKNDIETIEIEDKNLNNGINDNITTLKVFKKRSGNVENTDNVNNEGDNNNENYRREYINEKTSVTIKRKKNNNKKKNNNNNMKENDENEKQVNDINDNKKDVEDISKSGGIFSNKENEKNDDNNIDVKDNDKKSIDIKDCKNTGDNDEDIGDNKKEFGSENVIIKRKKKNNKKKNKNNNLKEKENKNIDNEFNNNNNNSSDANDKGKEINKENGNNNEDVNSMIKNNINMRDKNDISVKNFKKNNNNSNALNKNMDYKSLFPVNISVKGIIESIFGNNNDKLKIRFNFPVFAKPNMQCIVNIIDNGDDRCFIDSITYTSPLSKVIGNVNEVNNTVHKNDNITTLTAFYRISNNNKVINFPFQKFPYAFNSPLAQL